jgi:exopolysaccharide production protein ExoQ
VIAKPEAPDTAARLRTLEVMRDRAIGSISTVASRKPAAFEKAVGFGVKQAALERFYVVVALSVLSAIAFIVGDQPCCGEESLNPLQTLQASSTAGDMKKQLILLAIYAVCAIFLARMRVRKFVFLGVWLSTLVAWCFASVLWSTDPDVTLRRCIALAGTVLLGLYLGLRFSFRDLLSLLSKVVGVIIVGSLCVATVAPLHGLDYAGRLRGVFDHKNDLGGFAALGLLVLTARLWEVRSRERFSIAVYWFIAALSAISLAFTRSASPIPVLVFSLLTLFLAHAVRRANRSVVALLPVIAAVVLTMSVALASNSDTLAELLGRDADLSGRTRVWAFGLEMVQKRPLEGYGYGAFWTGDASPGAVFWRSTQLAVPHAHNGYLQLLLDAGAVGLALALAAVITAIFRLACLLRYDRNTPIPWALGYIGFLLATEITEPGIWSSNSLYTVLLVCVIVQARILAHRAANPAQGNSILRAAYEVPQPRLRPTINLAKMV